MNLMEGDEKLVLVPMFIAIKVYTMPVVTMV